MYKNEHKFPYRWTKKDANFTKDKGKVMSCFCCGGGSSFGYKLAGYDVVACNEIDPKVMKMYLKNHDVKYAFNCDIRELITNINMGGHIMKEELHNLDILDASFPCSVFSIAGDRQKAWGKEKVFREGQKAQRLDDLAFYSIAFCIFLDEIFPLRETSLSVRTILVGILLLCPLCETTIDTFLDLSSFGFPSSYVIVAIMILFKFTMYCGHFCAFAAILRHFYTLLVDCTAYL